MVWLVNATARLIYPQKTALVSIVQEAGWALYAGLNVCGEDEFPFLHPGFSPRTFQTVASCYSSSSSSGGGGSSSSSSSSSSSTNCKLMDLLADAMVMNGSSHVNDWIAGLVDASGRSVRIRQVTLTEV
jgi:hypothetical protein